MRSVLLREVWITHLTSHTGFIEYLYMKNSHIERVNKEFSKDAAREKFKSEHPSHHIFTSYQQKGMRPYSKVWTKEKIIKVAREYGDKSALELSLGLGITPGYINTMASRLRKDGINVKKNPQKNVYRAALAELKAESL